MKTHEFFRRACSGSLPDWDAAELMRRPAPKRRRAVRYAAAAAGLLLAAGLTVWLGLRGAAPGPGDPPAPVLEGPQVPVEAGAPEAETDGRQPPENAGDRMEGVRFNVLEEAASVSLDVGMSRLLLEHAQLWNMAEILEYWGCDPLPKALPEGLTPEFDEASRWQYAASPDGETVWDQFSFRWRERGKDGTAYDPLAPGLTVTVSGREIFQCGILLDRQDMEPSSVGGVTMYLGRRQMGYGPYTEAAAGPNQPAGYYDVLVAQFRWEGLYLDVTAENLTETEFVDVLYSMVAEAPEQEIPGG